MTGSVRDWLPPGAAENDRVLGALSQAVEPWSRRWFDKRVVQVGRLKAVAGAAPPVVEGAWIGGAQAVAANWPTRARLRLTEWALDVSLVEQSLSDADRQVLRSFQDKLLQDLLASIPAALGVKGIGHASATGDPFGGRGGVTAVVAEAGGGDLFTLAIPMAMVLPLCRPARSPSKARLDTMTGALGALPLKLDVALGLAELTFSDLKGLGVGDVLVLDTTLSEPAPVRLVHGSTTALRAKLADLDGTLALVVQDR